MNFNVYIHISYIYIGTGGIYGDYFMITRYCQNLPVPRDWKPTDLNLEFNLSVPDMMEAKRGVYETAEFKRAAAEDVKHTVQQHNDFVGQIKQIEEQFPNSVKEMTELTGIQPGELGTGSSRK